MSKYIKKIRKWIAKRKRYNNTVNELNSLSNRALKDLGISRSEIHRVARESIAKQSQTFK